MKKKILIGLGIIVLLVIGLLCYIVVSDLVQEKKLNNELYEISEMANAQNIDIDAIYERLNRTLTKNDYAKVEKAFKSYLRDNFDNSIRIAELLNDERIVTILTVENYLEDGKDFIETKQYINETRIELEKCKQAYIDFFTEEKAMSYINKYELDSYYIDLYMEEFVGDIESGIEDKTIENSIDEIIEILNISEQVIILLSENPNSWEIQGDNIVFNNDSLSNEYDNLLNQLS